MDSMIIQMAEAVKEDRAIFFISCRPYLEAVGSLVQVGDFW